MMKRRTTKRRKQTAYQRTEKYKETRNAKRHKYIKLSDDVYKSGVYNQEQADNPSMYADFNRKQINMNLPNGTRKSLSLPLFTEKNYYQSNDYYYSDDEYNYLDHVNIINKNTLGKYQKDDWERCELIFKSSK